jgi:hypothetical protein
MADATVLNTVGLCPCGFESRLRHWGDLQQGHSASCGAALSELAASCGYLRSDSPAAFPGL